MYSTTDRNCGYTGLWAAGKAEDETDTPFFQEEVWCLQYVVI